jgi:hypothetical protein
MVPRVEKQLGNNARDAVEKVGLKFAPRVPARNNEWVPLEKFNDDSLQGYTVVQEHPLADTWVLPNTAIVCFLQPPNVKPPAGPRLVTVPRVEKQLGNNARDAVEKVGLMFAPRVPGRNNEWVPLEKANANKLLGHTVAQQYPQPGESVFPRTPVVCYLQPDIKPPAGPRLVMVPRVEKQRGDQARDAVEKAGLVFSPRVPGRNNEWVPLEKANANKLLPGFTVAQQYPQPGESVFPRTPVVCYLQPDIKPPAGPRLVTVPRVEKQPGDQARDAVEKAGLVFAPRVPGRNNKWIPLEKFDDRGLQGYTVIEQHPQPGQSVLPGRPIVCHLGKKGG